MNQINILYTFNLHNVISQIYFNKKIKWKKVFFKKKTNKNVNNLTTSIQHSFGSVGHSIQGRKRSKRNPDRTRRSETLAVCR